MIRDHGEELQWINYNENININMYILSNGLVHKCLQSWQKIYRKENDIVYASISFLNILHSKDIRRHLCGVLRIMQILNSIY